MYVTSDLCFSTLYIFLGAPFDIFLLPLFSTSFLCSIRFIGAHIFHLAAGASPLRIYKAFLFRPELKTPEHLEGQKYKIYQP